MKKMILLLPFIMVSCLDKIEPAYVSESAEGDKVNMVVIDGHEYIEVENSLRGFQDYSYSLVHKEDCDLCDLCNPYSKKTDSLIMILIKNQK